MATFKITTTISEDDWKFAQQNRLRWADLVHKGVVAHMKPDVVSERLQMVENELNAYKKKLDNLRKKNFLGF